MARSTTPKRATIRLDEPDFDTATAIAVERSPFDSIANLARIRTHRVRVIVQPEKVFGNGNRRDYGRERKHPRTDTTKLIREFVFEK